MVVPLRKAIGIIFLSTVLVSGSSAFFLGLYQYIKQGRVNDSKYDILAIVQSTSEKEPLKTVYLSELLNLSTDQPTNIYRFNVTQGEQKLTSSPLIKKAKIKKIYPGTLYIHYISRIPVAYLTDYSNTAIDKDGIPIPFKPFFTPKILPEIYLGLEQTLESDFLGNAIQNKNLVIALKLLNYLNVYFISDQSTLKRIDVSQANAQSYGQKQIVVIMEDKIDKIKNGIPVLQKVLRILRLSPKGYKEELANYLTLRKYLMLKESTENGNQSSDSKIIDLRIPGLAFIKNDRTKQ
jgi:hypothetical protein